MAKTQHVKSQRPAAVKQMSVYGTVKDPVVHSY